MNRYVLLDENGGYITRFGSDAEVIGGGQYGNYVAYEGDGDIPAVMTEEPWVYLNVKPDLSMCQGDTMDIHTGHVTRPPPPPPDPPEEIVEGLA